MKRMVSILLLGAASVFAQTLPPTGTAASLTYSVSYQPIMGNLFWATVVTVKPANPVTSMVRVTFWFDDARPMTTTVPVVKGQATVSFSGVWLEVSSLQIEELQSVATYQFGRQ